MKPMKQVAQLLNDMLSAGVITNYAVFGAVAQMRYTQPVPTRDADILIAIPGTAGLDILRPVYDYCRARGLSLDGECVLVGPWRVQFFPPFSRLTEEALQHAEVGDFEGVPVRVIQADHLALIALDTGRHKDFMRILALVDSGAISLDALRPLADRHGLMPKLKAFRKQFRM